MANARTSFLFCLIVTAGSLHAQFGAPRLTVIFNEREGTMHPVAGVSIANRSGSALAGLPKFSRAAVSATGGFALAVSDTNALVLIRMPNGEPANASELAGLEAPDRILLSPRSQAAAVVKGGRVTLLSGLNGEPARRSFNRTLPANATHLAVNDAASRLAFFDPDRGSILVWSDGSDHIYPSARATAVQFVSASDDLLIAEESRVVLVRGGGMIPVVSMPEGVQPRAVASAGDGRYLFVADSAGRVQRVSARDFTSESFDCACGLSLLQAGPGYARFQVSKADPRYLTYLDWEEQPSLFSIRIPDAEVRQ